MKRLFLTLLMVAVFTLALAIGISATTYNYYEDEAVEENKLYQIEASFTSKNTRFEMISSAEGVGFAKVDEQGTPLTWYVVSDDLGSGVRNIVVKSTPTIGGVVGDVDANGNYTYYVDADGVSFSKKVVSVNFFGTTVKTLPEAAYMATYVHHTPGQLYQYCQIADGSYILALYLPKTLTAIPKQLCLRAPLIVLEFEDNKVSYKNLGAGVTGFDKGYPNEIAYPFSFCANLKRVVVPEGIETIPSHTFRNCMSLEYVKFPSTMTRLENNVFFQSIGIQTVVYGENMTYIGYFNSDYKKVWSNWGIQNFNIKYMYVPNTVSVANSYFDSYRGQAGNEGGTDRSIVFFFVGTLEEARVVSNYTNRHFKSAVNGVTSAANSTTPGQAPITYAEYLSNKEYYDNLPSNKHVLVYDVPKCVAFYDQEHIEVSEYVYVDAITPVKLQEGCTRCGAVEVTEFKPILEFMGYSAQIGGDKINFGYNVNLETAALFPNVSYGILVTVPVAGTDMSAYEPINPDGTPNVSNRVVVIPVEKAYGGFDLIVKSFSKNEENYKMPIIMCAYVTDGTDVDYLCLNDLDELEQMEYAKTVTFEAIAYETAPKFKVTFASANDGMGTVEGDASQIVLEGEKTTEVTAIAGEGYEFACWSDGTQDATVQLTPKKNMDLVAYFTPKSTGLPVMTINTEGGVDVTSKEYYITCDITLNDTETDNSIGGQLAEIKGRGNSTWTKFDKKPYKFKFDKKQNLFGYGKEKTWVLLADARDYSLVRNMLALNASLTMSELEYTSQGQSVELYVNGEYQGVYYLCEQIQVKENRVNITQEDEDLIQNPEDLGYLIEMDAWVSEDCGGKNNVPSYGITSDGDVFVRVDDGMYNGYGIKDPEDLFFDENGNFDKENAAPYLEYIQAYLVDSMAAVSGSDYEAVCELIDVKSFAQAYIIYEWFKNPDTNYSSVYFYKDAGGKLVCSPVWDFDMAVGNVTHKSGAGTNAQNFRDTSYLWSSMKNTWFRELLEFQEFRYLVGTELAANADTLRASIASDLAYVRTHIDAYEKNFEVWNLIGNTSATERMGAWSVPAEFKAFATYEEHLDYIENYLEQSLQNLINTYPAPSAQ